MKDRFASYHPVINFTFFIGAIAAGMFLLHPYFLLCSMFWSAVYYLTVQGRKGMRFLAGLAGLWGVLSLINPLFNTLGEHLLFTYLGDRPYTLEALWYGMALASMLASVLCWFASYQSVMTSDKFLYLFGGLAPSVTLILTMVLRLVPSYRKKVIQMQGARSGIGKGTEEGSARERAEHGMVLLSALTSWALEGGVITADSMQSRGYGCGRRSMYSQYRWEGRDKGMLAGMSVFLILLALCCVQGAAEVIYVPQTKLSGIENCWVRTGILAYSGFLAIPSAVNIWEELRWHSLRSKI